MGSIWRRRIASSETPSCAAPKHSKRVPERAQWLEERQSLDVVPMGMGDEDVGGDRTVAPGHELVTERAETAACVEDQQPATGPGNAHAGRVAAVACRVRPGVGIDPRVPQNRHATGWLLVGSRDPRPCRRPRAQSPCVVTALTPVVRPA